MLVNRAVKAYLQETTNEYRVFSYADNSLIVCPSFVASSGATEVFTSCLSGLSFTKEDLLHEELQYLDLLLHLQPLSQCLAFQQKSRRSVPNFFSNMPSSDRYDTTSRSTSWLHLLETGFLIKHNDTPSWISSNIFRSTLQHLNVASSRPGSSPKSTCLASML